MLSLHHATINIFEGPSHIAWKEYFQTFPSLDLSVEPTLIKLLKQKNILSNIFPADTTHRFTQNADPIPQLVELIRHSLASGNTIIVPIISQSMTPLLLVNEKAVIEHCDKSDLKVGDIIALFDTDGFLIHRLIKITKNDNNLLLITKGDASDNDIQSLKNI